MPNFPPSISPDPPLNVKPPPASFRDPASHSNPGIHFTDHIHLDIHLDYNTNHLHVTASYTFRVLDPTAPHLILDVRGLDIESITSDAISLEYTIEKSHSPIGAALNISLPPALRNANTLQLSIQYTTRGDGGGHPAGGALDWLSPQQTCSGAPFAFTQCQAIHARSILPCQDTPAVKATYSALVSLAAPHDDLTVVMSAQKVPLKQGDREDAFRFDCAVPVPSYLIALACGKLQFRELSRRCCVWAEPDIVEKAAWEFEQVEHILATAEQIAGRYVWGRYDLLVLPGSFPCGGMENPFLTFVTPTLLAGDRSLVSVVVHEIAHSWSGNLISCQDCRHFWLSEGVTVKLERRILRELYGSGREGLDATAGRRELDAAINWFGPDHRNTSLVTQLEPEEDPDNCFSCVMYEKGYNFLLWLEHLVNSEKGGDFDDFLRDYFHANRYQSITSTDFVDMFVKAFPDVARKVKFDEWLYGVGPCAALAPLDRSLVEEASSLADKWGTAFKNVQWVAEEDALKELRAMFGAHVADFKGWDSKQQHCFLTELKAGISEGKIVWNEKTAGYLQDLYGINEIRNSEIRFLWCRLAVSGGYENVLANVEDFLSSQGRVKFVRPLFNDLHNVFPKGRYATDLYARNKHCYHSLTCKMIEKDLGL